MSLSNGTACSGALAAAANVLQLSEEQRLDLESLYLEYPRPSPAHIQGFIKYRPALASLDSEFLRCWFAKRRSKEKRDEQLATLIYKNVKLRAEQQTLLLRNKELCDQTMLLNLENQQLKKQLEIQLQSKQSLTSTSAMAVKGNTASNENEESAVCKVEAEFTEYTSWSTSMQCSCSMDSGVIISK